MDHEKLDGLDLDLAQRQENGAIVLQALTIAMLEAALRDDEHGGRRKPMSYTTRASIGKMIGTIRPNGPPATTEQIERINGSVAAIAALLAANPRYDVPDGYLATVSGGLVDPMEIHATAATAMSHATTSDTPSQSPAIDRIRVHGGFPLIAPEDLDISVFMTLTCDGSGARNLFVAFCKTDQQNLARFGEYTELATTSGTTPSPTDPRFMEWVVDATKEMPVIASYARIFGSSTEMTAEDGYLAQYLLDVAEASLETI